MSHTADQLIALAANLEDLAVELLTEANDEKHQQFMEWLTKYYGYTHEQYSKFSREAKNHLHNMYENEEHKETKKEAAGQTFDEKEKEHKEWEKSHPKMKDWSRKDWKKYLSKEKKDSNEVDYPQPPDFGEDFKKYKKILDPKPENDEDAYQKWLKDSKPLTDEENKDLIKNIETEFDEEPVASADTYIRTAAKEKLNPKAKNRNRGKCVVPAERALDHTDHYPINSIEEGRAALRYVGKQKSAPWYRGSVESLRNAVERAVHSAYPELKKDKKKSSALEVSETLLAKYS
jgi:hypothetical protein